MGLNVTAVTDIKLAGCEVTFSKSFCYLLCGLDAHINPELGQLEKVLECDLTVLKRMDLYHYSEDEEIALLQTEAESPGDEDKIRERFRKGRAEAFQAISQLKSTLQKLLSQLRTSDQYYDQLAYNEQWLYDYFKGGCFEKDIQKVLGFVTCAEAKGASQMSFIME
jgi:hypothetical protein